MDQKTEAEIVVRVLKGDRQAYALLIEAYKNPIYNLAYRMTRNPQDAEDLAQETFLRSFRELSRFDVNRRFYTWLYTISLNIIRNHLKNATRKAGFQKIETESIDDSPMFSYEMESSVEYCEMVDFIRHSSNAKDKGRSLSYRILTDKVFRHQPMTVIADRYHLKKSAAYRRLNEARGDFYRSYLMNREQALSA